MASFHITLVVSLFVIALVFPAKVSAEQLLDKSNDVKSDESFKEAGRRNPRLGFNLVSFPNITLTPTNSTSNGIGLAPITVPPVISATLGTIAVVLKGLGALKAAIIPPLIIGALLIFLAAGAAFFACSVLDCGFGSSSHGTSYGAGSFSNPLYSLNRNSYEQYDQQQQQSRPVFQALEDGYKKY